MTWQGERRKQLPVAGDFAVWADGSVKIFDGFQWATLPSTLTVLLTREELRWIIAALEFDSEPETLSLRERLQRRCDWCGHSVMCCPTPNVDMHHHMVSDHSPDECP